MNFGGFWQEKGLPCKNRLYLDIQKRLEDECKYHRGNKEVDKPPIRATYSARTVGIFDADGLNNRIRTKGLLRRMQQDISPMPAGPLRACPHKAVTNHQLLFNLLVIHLENYVV